MAGPFRKGGPLPPRLAKGLERALLGGYLYHLYGMCTAVLDARMAAGQGDPSGPLGLTVPGLAANAVTQPLPLGRLRSPFTGGCGPETATLAARGPSGWRWAQEFVQYLV